MRRFHEIILWGGFQPPSGLALTTYLLKIRGYDHGGKQLKLQQFSRNFGNPECGLCLYREAS